MVRACLLKLIVLNNMMVTGSPVGGTNFALQFHRKKFGWLTFALNLFSYFCFIVPLTVLAVYGRGRMQSLCKPGVHIGDKVCNISLTVEVQI